jgi:pyruvate-formate lyase
LLEHADAIEHAAARGGYADDRTGARVVLDQTDRERWARFAAILRGCVHADHGSRP